MIVNIMLIIFKASQKCISGCKKQNKKQLKLKHVFSPHLSLYLTETCYKNSKQPLFSLLATILTSFRQYFPIIFYGLKKFINCFHLNIIKFT